MGVALVMKHIVNSDTYESRNRTESIRVRASFNFWFAQFCSTKQIFCLIVTFNVIKLFIAKES